MIIKTERLRIFFNSDFLSSFQNINNDKAVAFGILNKAWIFLSALISTPLLIIFLSPALQGFYFTFISILGLQTVFILGIGQLLQQFISHEWVKIDYDKSAGLKGDEIAIIRLSSIKNFTIKWYSWLTVILLPGMSIGGYFFMKSSIPNNLIGLQEWLLPWIAVCILKSLQVLISPGLIFLDAINEVESVNKFRTIQSIIERISSWIVLIIGGRLWLLAAGAFVNILGQISFFKKKYLTLFKHVYQIRHTNVKIWKQEILPIQWRLATSSFSGYLYFSFLVPMVFWYFGPIVAGKLGITWAMINMFWNLAVTPVAAAMPALAGFAAKKDFQSFKKRFHMSVVNSILLLFVGISVLYIGLIILNIFFIPAAGRFLGLLTAAIFLLAIIPHHLRFVMISYMRALKKEPFWFISIFESILLLFIFFLCSKYTGFLGLSISFLFVSTLSCCVNFIIFKKHQREIIS
ncbi:MAG: hypothetical protein ACYDA4_08380 [Ignavibacteriaceae bacterium]